MNRCCQNRELLNINFLSQKLNLITPKMMATTQIESLESPTFNQATLHVNEAAAGTGRKRKISAPIRSLQQLHSSTFNNHEHDHLLEFDNSQENHSVAEQKLIEGIVKLDVYSLYSQNPNQLFSLSSAAAAASASASPLLLTSSKAGPSLQRSCSSATLVAGGVDNSIRFGGAGMGACNNQEDSLMEKDMIDMDDYSQERRRVKSAFSDCGSEGDFDMLKDDGKSLQEEIMLRQLFTNVNIVRSGIVDMNNFKNTLNAPAIIWKKGSPLSLESTLPDYNNLTPEELLLSSSLRLLPNQYLMLKETFLTQASLRGHFKKRDAKSWFKIDVNKTAVLYDWFTERGWLL